MGVCNAVYFRLSIILMRILPPVTAEGYDDFHHLRYAKWGHVMDLCLKAFANIIVTSMFSLP